MVICHNGYYQKRRCLLCPEELKVIVKFQYHVEVSDYEMYWM